MFGLRTLDEIREAIGMGVLQSLRIMSAGEASSGRLRAWTLFAANRRASTSDGRCISTHTLCGSANPAHVRTSACEKQRVRVPMEARCESGSTAGNGHNPDIREDTVRQAHYTRCDASSPIAAFDE